MQIIVRYAVLDFDALMTAQGMEDAGAEVFSITLAGRYLVFAKYDPSKVTPIHIDASINKLLFPTPEATNG